MIEEARKQGRSAVFALTVQPYVGEFFEKLGFLTVPREELPDDWKKGYDFSRPSKGYLFKLRD
jgi:N-acetylglutamate synthase-like GNAT family acetyltransferase